MARTALPAPSVSFDGLNNSDVATAFGFKVLFPSTNIDVGPNHVVQMINKLVRIYNKTGTPLTSPFKLSAVFAALGGVCSTNDDGDPIVLYDPLADRWMLSQFAIPNVTLPPWSMCIAISQTPDPTGSYFLYEFPLGGPGGNQFPDYPKLAVWPDGYYMTVKQVTNLVTFANPGAVAFDRLKMLVGDPTAIEIYFDLSSLAPVGSINGMLPSDLDGLATPPVGAPNVFVYPTATENGDPADALRLFDFHADFDFPANSTFTERPESPIAVAAYDPFSAVGADDVPQPGTTEKLESLAEGQLMHRLQYRNRGGFESLVVNHTVDVSGDPSDAVFRAGVRYYELRRTTGAANALSVFEQATFAPADTAHRWMGSAAVDNDGNLALGYSVSSATVFPSIRYAGKLAGEAVGVIAETSMIAGAGSQTSSTSRWGQYTMLAVDPSNDCTFWYTNEYYAATSSMDWLTRIASFGYPQCTAAPKGTIQGTITNCSDAQPVDDASVSAVEGYFDLTDATGSYSMAVAPGTYTLAVSAFGFDPATGMVTASDGGTSILNICLNPIPVIESAGATLTAEGCAPANGVVDPGETVTVSLCLENNGAADTTNLVGTLQATGGVTFPSGPQNYGAVEAGGSTVCRNYTFTAAGSCGGTVTATLALNDGGSDLGELEYDFTLGVLVVAFTENFDGVTPPALPVGWTETEAQDAGNNSSNWATTGTSPDTAPNDAFTNDPNNISDELLDTPAISITSAIARLQFRNNFNLEDGFDGGVLEIKVGGGAFQDILAAGGSFVQNGYTDTISNGFSSPIALRQAWSGNSNGYVTTIANLPAAAMGQSIVLRFRRATDNGIGGSGWRIDTLQITEGFQCCTGGGGACSLTCPVNPLPIGSAPGLCSAVANYPPPTTSGICGAITCTPASGSVFAVGTTTVSCTNATMQGNCSFTVEVVDDEPPAVICPADVFDATPFSSLIVDFEDATPSDNCPNATASCVPPSGSTFPAGVTTVTCTATDDADNTALCDFAVSVTQTAPVIPAVSRTGIVLLALLLAVGGIAVSRRWMR